jgi:hypothetical protein
MHALSLHFMFYNFCTIHKSLRVTPAMEAGIDDRVWTMEEVVMMADTNCQARCYRGVPMTGIRPPAGPTMTSIRSSSATGTYTPPLARCETYHSAIHHIAISSSTNMVCSLNLFALTNRDNTSALYDRRLVTGSRFNSRSKKVTPGGIVRRGMAYAVLRGMKDSTPPEGGCVSFVTRAASDWTTTT